MWAQQRYALQPSTSARREGETLAHSTTRGVRAAVAQFYAWDWTVCYPTRALRDANQRLFLADLCSPTDSLAYTSMTKGLAIRQGDKSTPSKALLHRHVVGIDNYFESLFWLAPTDTLRAEACRGALSNTMFWLGWFRGGELYPIEWRNLLVIDPGQGGQFDLPDTVGGIRFHFDTPTKTSRATDTDLWIAYTSCSGLSPGKWLHRLRRALGLLKFPISDDLIFALLDSGDPWTSRYYRETYLYPVLELLRAQGDAYLAPYDGSTSGSRLRDAFYSMHCYRDGARPGCLRQVTKEEVYNHARWRLARANEPIDQQYSQPGVLDLLGITLFCQ